MPCQQKDHMDSKKRKKPLSSKIDEYQLPERLTYFRTRRGLTQAQLAKLVKLSQSTIAQIEAGKKDPSISTLKNIASALDLHISVLFAGSDVHVFDMNRLKKNYDHLDKLNPTLYFALAKIIEYAREIGFIK
jgi:transcriptional regulator with XRE-family HTH domain